MVKKSNIRWLERDNQRLEREVKYYNAKIQRKIKAGLLTLENSPPKMNLNDIKADTTNRKQLNKIYKTLEYAHQKEALKINSNKYGLEVTNITMRDINQKLRKLNKGRKEERIELENLPIKSRGKIIDGMIKDRLDDVLKSLEPKKMKFDKKSKTGWQMFVETVETQSSDIYRDEKMQRFKDNYIKGINSVFGEEKARQILKQMEGLTTKEFMTNYFQDTEGDMEFLYDENTSLAMRYKGIKTMWTADKKLRTTRDKNYAVIKKIGGIK